MYSASANVVFVFTSSHEISDKKSGNFLLGPSGVVVYELLFGSARAEKARLFDWGMYTYTSAHAQIYPYTHAAHTHRHTRAHA